MIVVATITIVSALFQIVLTEAALAFVGITSSDEATYLFRLASLLPGLFGGVLLHSRLAGREEPTVLLWASMQKLLVSGVVALGVLNKLLVGSALSVAGYDFVAGLFLLWYWSSVKLRRGFEHG